MKTVNHPIDYKDCPQYGQHYLANNSKVHFAGIFNYIFKQSGERQNVREVQFICSTYDQMHPPVNVFTSDYRYFKTGPAKKDQFIGIRLWRIKIRPSAVCIKSLNLPLPNKCQALRSFLIAGKVDDKHSAVVLHEFSYTRALKHGGSEIFYLNTDLFFDHIFIQQTAYSFDNERVFAILQLEVHGEIQKISRSSK